MVTSWLAFCVCSCIILSGMTTVEAWFAQKIVTPPQLGNETLGEESPDEPDYNGPNTRYISDHLMWPDKIVVYRFDFDFPAEDRAIFTHAKKYISDRTCIRFKAKSYENDFVHVSKSDECSSYFGRIGSRQDMTVADYCGNMDGHAHELVHVIGVRGKKFGISESVMTRINNKYCPGYVPPPPLVLRIMTYHDSFQCVGVNGENAEGNSLVVTGCDKNQPLQDWEYDWTQRKMGTTLAPLNQNQVINVVQQNIGTDDVALAIMNDEERSQIWQMLKVPNTDADGLIYRIVNIESGRCLQRQESGEPVVTADCDATQEYQWWLLELISN